MRARTFFDLLIFKTGANLRTEVSRYYLNYLWWAIEPILTMLVFYLVFGIFLNRGTENFVAFLLCGITAWQWFQRSVTNASTSILANRGLILQVEISKSFFPLEVILRDGFKHLFVVCLLLVFLIFYPTPVSLTWMAFPLLLAIQVVFIAGSAILCAALVPFVPDLKFIINTTLHLMFFGSGIFYNIEQVILPQHRYIMYLNPMAGLVKNYRAILINNQWPDWSYLLYVLLAGLLLLSFSLWLTMRLDHVYPRICQQ
ncbi:MAG: ABC transporter permease [Pseudomonadota bacterium]